MMRKKDGANEMVSPREVECGGSSEEEEHHLGETKIHHLSEMCSYFKSVL
jgi:hypothetical protein